MHTCTNIILLYLPLLLLHNDQCTCIVPSLFDHVLRDQNPGLLKSEIGPFSDFKNKSYLMSLKPAHFQKSDFQQSDEADRFLEMELALLKTVFVLHGQAFVYAFYTIIAY